MPSDLTGRIDGLLRRGSPVRGVISNEPCVVVEIEDGRCAVGTWLNGATCRGPFAADSFALDLTDRTGRVHAAWWARDQGVEATIMRPEHRRALGLALAGEPMTDDEIADLRDLCLRLAEEVTDGEWLSSPLTDEERAIVRGRLGVTDAE